MNPIDVWFLFTDTGDEPHAEANTFRTDTGYRVEWSLTDVGQVTTVEFDTLAKAHKWLEDNGYSDFTN